MPTFYEARHYNNNTRNYKTLNYRTSLAAAEKSAIRYMDEIIGTLPQYRKYHCVKIYKHTSIGTLYFEQLVKTIE